MVRVRTRILASSYTRVPYHGGTRVHVLRLFRQPVKKSKGRNNGGFPDLLSTTGMAYQRAVHGNGRFFSYRVRENRRKGG